MKLIDLLVQELPKRGGWPQDSESMCQSAYDNEIYTDSDLMHDFYVGIRAEDSGIENEVTREQYEAALAASHQPAWICGAMPPEGCECEVKSGKDSWTLCKVVHSSSAGVAFIYLEEPNGCASYLGVLDSISAKAAESQFRPIRTEAERKREEAKNVIAELCRSSASNGHSADLIYDAIAAGKIPGVKIDDL